MVGWPGRRSRCTALHRLVYVQHKGLALEDIADQVVRHTCDNPRCINPTHLLLGTRADNNRDRAERGRSAKQVPSRQSLTDIEIVAIRRRYIRYSRTDGCRAIAQDYSVDQSYIHRIVNNLERPCEYAP